MTSWQELEDDDVELEVEGDIQANQEVIQAQDNAEKSHNKSRLKRLDASARTVDQDANQLKAAAKPAAKQQDYVPGLELAAKEDDDEDMEDQGARSSDDEYEDDDNIGKKATVSNDGGVEGRQKADGDEGNDGEEEEEEEEAEYWDEEDEYAQTMGVDTQLDQDDKRNNKQRSQSAMDMDMDDDELAAAGNASDNAEDDGKADGDGNADGDDMKNRLRAPLLDRLGGAGPEVEARPLSDVLSKLRARKQQVAAARMGVVKAAAQQLRMMQKQQQQHSESEAEVLVTGPIDLKSVLSKMKAKKKQVEGLQAPAGVQPAKAEAAARPQHQQLEGEGTEAMDIQANMEGVNSMPTTATHSRPGQAEHQQAALDSTTTIDIVTHQSTVNPVGDVQPVGTADGSEEAARGNAPALVETLPVLEPTQVVAAAAETNSKDSKDNNNRSHTRDVQDIDSTVSPAAQDSNVHMTTGATMATDRTRPGGPAGEDHADKSPADAKRTGTFQSERPRNVDRADLDNDDDDEELEILDDSRPGAATGLSGCAPRDGCTLDDQMAAALDEPCQDPSRLRPSHPADLAATRVLVRRAAGVRAVGHTATRLALAAIANGALAEQQQQQAAKILKLHQAHEDRQGPSQDDDTHMSGGQDDDDDDDDNDEEEEIIYDGQEEDDDDDEGEEEDDGAASEAEEVDEGEEAEGKAGGGEKVAKKAAAGNAAIDDEAGVDGDDGDDNAMEEDDVDAGEDEREWGTQGKQDNTELEPEPLAFEEDEPGLDDDHDTEDRTKDTNKGTEGGTKKQLVDVLGKDRVALAAARRAKEAAARRALGGLIDAEAELSEDEEGLGAAGMYGDDEEEEEGPDGMLADLLGTAQEGAKDELRRARLHKEWEQERDQREIRQVVHALRHGHKRPNKNGPNLGGEDGTDADARRRRALLFGDVQIQEEEGNVQGMAEWARAFHEKTAAEEEEEEDADDNPASAARREQHEMRKRLKTADAAQHKQGSLPAATRLSSLNRKVSEEVRALVRNNSSNTGLPDLHHNSASGNASKHGNPGSKAGGNQAGKPRSVVFDVFGKDLTNRPPTALSRAGPSSLIGKAPVGQHRSTSSIAARSFVFGTGDNSNSAAALDKGDGNNHAGGKATSFAGVRSILGGGGGGSGAVGSKLAPHSLAKQHNQQAKRETSLFNLLDNSCSRPAAY